MADGTQSTELARLEPEQRGTSLAVQLARADVDQQITTARAYPRDPRRVMNSIMSLATLDEQTSTECVYALSRAGKPIRGPSIRLAEIIASQWGNCRVGAHVVHVDRFEKYIEAEGVYHDLETNAATTARVRRSIRTKQGGLFSDDMIVVAGNAACSIARRNAILGGVPRAAWGKAYDAVERVIAGDVKTLSERRDAALKAFAAFGVGPAQLCAALDIGSVDQITLDHLVTLTGMHSALKSGEETVETMFAAKSEPSAGPPPAPKRIAKAAQPQPAAASEAADPPIVDPETYITHLEEEMVVAAQSGHQETLQEVWDAHLESADGRLGRAHQEKAEGLFRKYSKQIAAKAKAAKEAAADADTMQLPM